MSVTNLDIPGSWVFTPKQFSDDRGTFFEWFQDDTFLDVTGHRLDLAQANCSISKKGTLRGIHFAEVPPGQRKYVTCLSGSVMDVLVDLRIGSPTFGEWRSVHLDAIDRRVVFIPNGVGHAFLALEEQTTVVYLCDSRFNPSREREINPMDPEIDINWPSGFELKLSDKDANAKMLSEMMDTLPNY